MNVLSPIVATSPSPFANEAERILSQTRDMSVSISRSFDTTWTTTVNGDLYKELANYGAIIAILSLGLGAIPVLKAWSDGAISGGKIDYTVFIWPVLMIVLLGTPTNRGILLGSLTMQARSLGNEISQTLLSKLNDSMSARVMDAASLKVYAQMYTATAIRTCGAIQDRTERNNCFDQASQTLINIGNTYGGSTVWGQLTQIQDAQGSDYATSNWFARFTSAAINNDAVMSAAIALLTAIGTAFFYVSEIALLCVAVLGPLASGASLLPVAGRPIEAWLSGFLGVLLIKFMYSVVVGLAATMTVASTLSSPIIYPLIVGIFGPLIAFALGTWSGLSLMGTFTRLAGGSLIAGLGGGGMVLRNLNSKQNKP